MAHSPHALLIDLDDTLIDYGGSAALCWRRICGQMAAEIDGFDGDSFYDALDAVRTWYWADAERHRQGRTDLRAASAWIIGEALRRVGRAEACAYELADRYREMRWQTLEIIPGAHQTLAALRATGARMALVTNGTSAEQRAKIARFQLAPYFDHIQIEGEFGRGKPEPEVYVAALAAVEAEPQQAWFVGDNLEWDVAAPQRGGMFGVWVDRHRQGVPRGSDVRPDRVIASITELAEAGS
ncbi:MAG TPA: HAD family hydrolase [Terriglobales bacterium]|nr:HAD family hydrolase [Terriglobales bacterium]